MRQPGALWIYRGLPASGKTTEARERINASAPGSVVRLNRDDLRACMLREGYRRPEYASEELVSEVQHGAIPNLLRRGVDVIVDDTNLRSRTVRDLAQLARKVGAEWYCVDRFLEVPVEECVRRDAARENPVGEDVIRGMWGKFLSGGRKLSVPEFGEEVAGKPYVPPIGAPRAVLIDIDGTVALHGDRDPYDTTRYHEDTPNTPVIEAIHNEDRMVEAIIFCSGRSEEFREVTEKWLVEHVAPIGEEDIFTIGPGMGGWQLLMRPAGDTRNDAVVKLELFDKHIRDHYDVRRVYDDRDRVVAAWRSIGLTVLQVAEGNF